MKPSEDDEPIREIWPTEPAWEYPKSKLATQRVIEQERGKIRAVILRIAGVYDENCNSVPISKQISRIYEKKLESYLFPGDASKGQAFVHLDDLTDCFHRAVERRRELGEFAMFLIAEPDVMSYEEQQELHWRADSWQRMADHMDSKDRHQSRRLDARRPGGERGMFIKPWMIDLADQHFPVAIGNSREKLGWEPRHRLRDTLPEMIESLKRHPKRWYEENKLRFPEAKEKR